MRYAALVLLIGIDQASAFNHGPVSKACGSHKALASTSNVIDDERRREFLGTLIASVVAIEPMQAGAENMQQSSATQSNINGIHDPHLQDYYNPLLPKWRGTSLPGPLSLSEAYSSVFVNGNPEPLLSMGRWPDPILRYSASPISSSVFKNEGQIEKLQLVASALKNTARKEGAVGLAAQQCGVDASLIFIDGVEKSARLRSVKADDSSRGRSNFADATNNGVFGQSSWRGSQKKVSGEGAIDDTFFKSAKRRGNNPQSEQKDEGIFLVNPRIIQRSPESEMLVWTEECLVLPPEFRATLLRDAEITIEYECLEMNDAGSSCGTTEQITLRGELARCAQHEMDHDRGVLIVDHVSLDELLSMDKTPFMANIENSDGLHQQRMQRAYSRYLSDSSLIPGSQRVVPLAMQNHLGYHAKVKQVEHQPWFVQPANAIDMIEPNRANQISGSLQQPEDANTDSSTECDSQCLEERKRLIQQRRAMMQQSRTNTRRGDVLELSRQRAYMYGTEFQGLKPEICSKPGFCL